MIEMDKEKELELCVSDCVEEFGEVMREECKKECQSLIEDEG